MNIWVRYAKADYLTGLDDGAVCPECGSKVHVPQYPLMTLIPDEGCFRIEQHEADLQWHEEPELKAEPHWSWDQQGRRFQLQWAKDAKKVVPAPARSDEIQLFLVAARWHLRHADERGAAPHHGEIEVLRTAAKKLDRDELRFR